VGYKEADDAYIVVVDRSGKIAYQAHGTTTPEKGYAPTGHQGGGPVELGIKM
jgi:hypothetical protein